MTDTDNSYNNIPLDALVRLFSKKAEQLFKKKGTISLNGNPGPLWFVETPKGVVAISSPIPAGDAANYKEGIAEEIRQFFQEHNATRYVMVSEGWMVKKEDDTYGSYTTLEHHPKRKRVVSIIGEDGCQAITAIREVVRPSWRKPYLAKPEYLIDDYSDRKGRFSDLLPNRTTH